jgi:hypothetical protein
VNLGLQHDVDDEAGHVPNSTRAWSSGCGKDPQPQDVTWQWVTMARFRDARHHRRAWGTCA